MVLGYSKKCNCVVRPELPLTLVPGTVPRGLRLVGKVVGRVVVTGHVENIIERRGQFQFVFWRK